MTKAAQYIQSLQIQDDIISSSLDFFITSLLKNFGIQILEIDIEIDIIETFSADPEDVEDILRLLFKTYRLTFPSLEEQYKFYDSSDIVTLKKLIDFIIHFSYIQMTNK